MGKLTFKRHYLFYFSALYLLYAAVGDFDFDYGFYQILRFVAFFSFGFASFTAYSHKQQITPFILGLIAIVFNPFLPIYLERETWQLVDIVSGLFLILWTITTFKDAIYAFFNQVIKKNKKVSIAAISIVAIVFILLIVGWPFVHKYEEPAAASAEYLNTDPLLDEHESGLDQIEPLENNDKVKTNQDIIVSGENLSNPNIDQLAVITTTTEGLTIGEVQQINSRRKELGLPVLLEKNNNHSSTYNPERPFKSEAINDIYQNSPTISDQNKNVAEPQGVELENNEASSPSSEVVL
ncbi:Uncharacterised protein [Acinetobacter pittii]|uniref:DUF6804 family protein n=1 Tax=Acinetobacter pittii TaxID=48296 RepID=UPI00031F8988|nr:DUF6804 family protein [Acinetobacter pittii]MDP7813825.1 hypothetical protein [Acinetobacter pittii]SSP31604.1 Uncharacterised protein [Acinetobacter pittii]